MMTEDELGNAEIAQAEKIGLGDLVIAALLAAFTWTLQVLWEYPGMHPSVWGDAAVSVGVRPATHVMPGYWLLIANSVYALFGFNGGPAVMKFLGHGVLVGIAVCVYAVMREALTFIMRARPQLSNRRTLVMRLAAVVGTIAFICMDPVWTAGQCFSETTILLALTLGALECYFVFLRKGTIKYAYLGAMLLGALAAETTLGFLLPILLIFLYLFIAEHLPNLESPLFKPAVMEVGKWHITFIYAIFLAGGIGVNCWMFVLHGGIGAAGETMGHLPLLYALGYWSEMTTASNVVGWLMMTAICFAPFVVMAIRFPSAADEEQFLPYATGLIAVFCSLLAFAQCAFLSALWFWTYFPIKSQYLLTMALFCSALTLAGGVTTLGVDALCRNHERLAQQIFGNEDDDGTGDGILLKSHTTTLLKRVCIVIIPFFLVAMMLPGRVKTTTRQMLGMISDVVAEIVREAGDARFLFTDGNLDTAIEYESARQGAAVRCYSLMGGSDPMDGYLRTRGLTDDPEDKFSFGFDTGMGLRSWIRDKPERLKASAALMGFDLWKRDAKPLPPMGGLLSRPAGFVSEEERLRGIGVAHAFVDRILAIHRRRGGVKTCNDEAIRDAFDVIQWRVARMCSYRSEVDDLKGDVENAIAETKRAKSLNDCNATYKKTLEAMEKRNASMMQKLTAREGLQLALVRADFATGKTYAETILGSEPDNPDANFAMGMFYLGNHQLSLAETYLKRCLIRKPKEPAVYNNLAMIQIEQGRFEAAEVNIRKALEIVPDSAAVLDTRKALEAARAK